ncbi:CocE/NonD family hydrolase [Bordetella sp. BOR01]|uniref:CocE/NonD family hydrolase n=1 Tax=Bordetella sp. BOR01 TaxID=2854779 RepID=UPI001C47944F|nr:CocE/NonD family hydrolase [Bordetella sp. BOR01]MBV7483695.1 CocE/NonD family hydrolase [Bordetella sp. BOR01]
MHGGPGASPADALRRIAAGVQQIDIGVLLFIGIDVSMRDGTLLTANVYCPAPPGEAAGGALPVVLERTPYGRASARFHDFGLAAARAGYVFMIQDVRGRGDSGGRFHMMTNVPDEGVDGIDTWNWLLAQPWCDGRLATVGGSFSAANQQAMALHRPAGLRAQVLRDAGTNYRQRMFRYHGAFNVGVALPWAIEHGLQSPQARDDAGVRDALTAMRERSAQWADELPLRRGQSALASAPDYEDVYFAMLETADDTSYWHNPTVRLEGRWDDYPDDVAVLMVSGWFAHHANANLDKLRELGRRLKQPVRLVMGPWVHSPAMLEATSAGEAEFGPAAGQHGPIHAAWLAWLDRFVLGHENGAGDEPALRYFVMGLGDGHKTAEGRVFHGGQWRESAEWPLPSTLATPYYLHADGRLGIDRPSVGAAPLGYRYDPADPCPGIGASSLQSETFPAFVLPGPRDQRCRPTLTACRGSDRPLAERADVLVFQTEPLAQDCEVTGPLSVRLWVASSAPDTDFTAKLLDIYPPSADFPDGVALLLSEGILRMRYRDDRATGELIEPGREYAVTVELNPTSNVFKAGHRIRLDISSSSFPEYDLNPNTGEAPGAHTHTQVATQTLFVDGLRASHIVLPLQPISAEGISA